MQVTSASEIVWLCYDDCLAVSRQISAHLGGDWFSSQYENGFPCAAPHGQGVPTYGTMSCDACVPRYFTRCDTKSYATALFNETRGSRYLGKTRLLAAYPKRVLKGLNKSILFSTNYTQISSMWAAEWSRATVPTLRMQLPAAWNLPSPSTRIRGKTPCHTPVPWHIAGISRPLAVSRVLSEE